MAGKHQKMYFSFFKIARFVFPAIDVDVGNVEVQIKRDPTDDNNFRLHLGGKRVFQWFKEKWQSLKQTVKKGFGIR